MPARKPPPVRPKRPKLLCPDGRAANELRRKRGLPQAEFWPQIGVTQSGGSRYESGRPMPAQVALLLHMAYGNEQQALEMLSWVRRMPAQRGLAGELAEMPNVGEDADFQRENS